MLIIKQKQIKKPPGKVIPTPLVWDTLPLPKRPKNDLQDVNNVRYDTFELYKNKKMTEEVEGKKR